MFNAADGGLLGEVRRLVELGADVRSVDCWGQTPLHVAALQGHVEVVKELVELGADVGVRDDNNGTALHMAACCHQREVIKMLVALGADVGERNPLTGETPLHMAAEDVKVIEPLHMAAEHVKVMELLVDLGADVGDPNQAGSTKLYMFGREGNAAETVKLLVALGANVGDQDAAGWTALHRAADKGYLEVVKALLELGANPHARDSKGRTAANCATEPRIQMLLYCVTSGGCAFSSLGLGLRGTDACHASNTLFYTNHP